MLLSAMMFSGCGERSVDVSKIPQIMMITEHQNYADDISQSITVIDREGNRRSMYCFNTNRADGKPEEWVELSEDGWYEKLLDIAENGEAKEKLSKEDAEYIRQNVMNFEQWSSLPVKEYKDHTYDFGVETLYGIYFDDSGKPCLAELACIGDAMECADSNEVIKFVNKTGLLYMLGMKFT